MWLCWHSHTVIHTRSSAAVRLCGPAVRFSGNRFVSRNDASTSLWLLKFVLVLFRICYLGVIILVHIGAKCANIVSLSGQRISWVTELRYLGIFLTCSRIFTCSTDSAKHVLSIALLMLLAK